MPKGWKTNVFRTDVTPHKFVGFFYDESAALDWIKKQTEGTYEATTDRVATRLASSKGLRRPPCTRA